MIPVLSLPPMQWKRTPPGGAFKMAERAEPARSGIAVRCGRK